MDERQYAILLKDANINITQEEHVMRHLRHHLGKEFLQVKTRIVMLYDGHEPVHIGHIHIEHKYKDSREAEKVEYNIKALEMEICIQFERLRKRLKMTREMFLVFQLLQGATIVMWHFRWE